MAVPARDSSAFLGALAAAAGTAGQAPGAGHNGLCVLPPLQPQKGEETSLHQLKALLTALLTHSDLMAGELSGSKEGHSVWEWRSYFRH